jgi:hypothetical protein
VSERRQEGDHLWAFPEGMLGHDDSIKDFQVEATDGDPARSPGRAMHQVRAISSSASGITSTRLTMSFPPPPP